jgi:hypothetical protein
MLNNDAIWHLKNLDQVSAFRKWIDLVESSTPKQIASLVKSAANAAIGELNARQDTADRLTSGFSPDGDWFQSYWYLDFDEEKNGGAVVCARIPGNIEWLTSEGDDLPSLGLYFESKFGDKKLKVVGERVSAAVKKLPSRDCKRVNKLEDGWFICVEQTLSNRLDVNSVLEQKKLHTNLTKLFKEFTIATHPALEYWRKLVNKMQRA